jgi:hypothetical protein
LPDI